jgi:hypothetical protein
MANHRFDLRFGAFLAIAEHLPVPISPDLLEDNDVVAILATILGEDAKRAPEAIESYLDLVIDDDAGTCGLASQLSSSEKDRIYRFHGATRDY